MVFSGRDMERLQGALLELHEPRDLAGLREVAPVVFTRVIPADYFVWAESGHGRLGDVERDGVLWESPARMDADIRQKLMSLADDHPFTRHIARTGDLGPMRLSDFWTRRQQLASAMHQHVYEPLGVGRLLVAAIVRGHRAGTLNLSRPPGARDFSRRDREALRLLAPHFVQALAAAELATTLRAARAGGLRGMGLTSREADVGEWLARGRTNPEIAAILAMKPRTVEKHVENILLKLGVENRTSAARVILGTATDGAGKLATPRAARPAETLLRVLRPAHALARPRRRGTGGR